MITWRCEACHQIRPDSKISVLSYPLRDKGRILKGATANYKYCNDNSACYAKAIEKSKKGDIV